jgi:hypothetical protein
MSAGWKHQFDLMAAVNGPDVDALVRMFGPEVEVLDHRPGQSLDRAGLLELLRRCQRVNLELLDTTGDVAVMSRLHLVGTGVVLGQIAKLCNGRVTRVELFEPDDELGMSAGLARATGKAVLATPRPVLATVLQRHLGESPRPGTAVTGRRSPRAWRPTCG